MQLGAIMSEDGELHEPNGMIEYERSGSAAYLPPFNIEVGEVAFRIPSGTVLPRVPNPRPQDGQDGWVRLPTRIYGCIRGTFYFLHLLEGPSVRSQMIDFFSYTLFLLIKDGSASLITRGCSPQRTTMTRDLYSLAEDLLEWEPGLLQDRRLAIFTAYIRSAASEVDYESTPFARGPLFSGSYRVTGNHRQLLRPT